MINVISSSRYKIEKKWVKEIALNILEKESVGANQTLNVVFVGKNKMRSIALTYKKEDVALPVLSFSYKSETGQLQTGEKLFGEIMICYPQAILLAAERGKTVRYILEYLIDHGINNLVK